LFVGIEKLKDIANMQIYNWTNIATTLKRKNLDFIMRCRSQTRSWEGNNYPEATALTILTEIIIWLDEP